MPTIFAQMSKRCAIGYVACQDCADKQAAKGNFGILPDQPITLETMERMKTMDKWPPQCAFCLGPAPYRIEVGPLG